MEMVPTVTQFTINTQIGDETKDLEARTRPKDGVSLPNKFFLVIPFVATGNW
jgi:hypothetical protein